MSRNYFFKFSYYSKSIQSIKIDNINYVKEYFRGEVDYTITYISCSEGAWSCVFICSILVY